MALTFPNLSRSHIANRKSVCFWGYDSTYEITFYMGEDALHLMSPQSHLSEETLLEAFDSNRDRIVRVAAKVYGRKRQHSYQLSAPDFA